MSAVMKTTAILGAVLAVCFVWWTFLMFIGAKFGDAYVILLSLGMVFVGLWFWIYGKVSES